MALLPTGHLLSLPPLFPTTHPPSCSSSLLPPSPQVDRGLRREHKGPISRLLVQYLENANQCWISACGVCVCVCVCVCVFCHVLTSRIGHNFRSIKHHLRKTQLRSTGLQKKQKRKIHCGPASFITGKVPTSYV